MVMSYFMTVQEGKIYVFEMHVLQERKTVLKHLVSFNWHVIKACCLVNIQEEVNIYTANWALLNLAIDLHVVGGSKTIFKEKRRRKPTPVLVFVGLVGLLSWPTLF